MSNHDAFAEKLAGMMKEADVFVYRDGIQQHMDHAEWENPMWLEDLEEYGVEVVGDE